MNIKENTVRALEVEGYLVSFTDGNTNEVSKDNAVELVLTNIEKGMIGESIKVPKKKEVTVDWVMDKLNKESQFRNIAKEVSGISNDVSAYPASYGIGVVVLFGLNQDLVEKVKGKLDNLGVSYRNEYSEEGLVYRFIISKKQSNLSKIKA